MFFFASQFNNAELKTLTSISLGTINFVAIDPAYGKIVGFVFQKGLIGKKTYVVSPRSIVEAGEGMVIIRSEADVDEIEEIIRAKKVWEDNLDFFGLPAITESGKLLGRLKDMLVDKESFYIHRFYIQDKNSERILSRDLLIGVRDRKLVFKDEALNRPNLSPIENLKTKPKPVLA